jgi:hypothetical protein
MSIEDGSYRIFNGGNEKYALAFYDSDTVKLNITGNVSITSLCMIISPLSYFTLAMKYKVRVEIKSQSGGQMIRFNDSRVNPRTSNWFGYNTNLKVWCAIRISRVVSNLTLVVIARQTRYPENRKAWLDG